MNHIQKKALLRKWKTIIEQANTNRKDLKKSLLELVTIKDETEQRITQQYDDFINRRKQLLDENHQQGFTWTSHLQGLWSWLSYFLPVSWRPFPGSQLREALLKEPVLPEFEILAENDLAQESNQEEITNSSKKEIDEPDIIFEEDLINNPARALKGFYFQLDGLSKDMDGLFQGSSDPMLKIFERLSLLKASIDPQAYYRLLEKLYERQPIKTLSYFYQAYQQDTKEGPELSHDFIEQHLWVKTILDLLVRSESNQYTQIYTIQKLLIFLSSVPKVNSHPKALVTDSKTKTPIDFFGKLFETWSQSPKRPLSALEVVYDKHKGYINNQIDPLLSKQTKENRAAKTNFSVSQLDGHSYLRILNDIHDYVKPNSHPLLKHLARQAGEQLLFLYHQNRPHATTSTWQEGHEGAETLRFISRLLGINKILYPLDSGSYFPGLNPLEHEMLMIFGRDYPYDFKNAERSAVEIILSAMDNDRRALDTARQIRQKYLQNPSSFFVAWIEKRAQYINPKLLPRLRYMLEKVHLYGIDELPSHQITDFSTSPSLLVEQIEEHFLQIQQAHEAFNVNKEKAEEEKDYAPLDKLLNQLAEQENKASALLFQRLIQLLSHPAINSQLIKAAEKIIERFKGYLTETLKNDLDRQIKVRQQQLCQWQLQNLGEFNTTDFKLDLQTALDYKKKAHSAGLLKEYEEEYRNSQIAVCIFSCVIENNDKDSHFLRQAAEVLDELQDYLTEGQYKSWKDHIAKGLYQSTASNTKPSGSDSYLFSFFTTPIKSNNKKGDGITLQDIRKSL